MSDAGLLAIQWDVSTGDPDPHQSAQAIANAILAHAKPGSIVLMHANALPFRAESYEIRSTGPNRPAVRLRPVPSDMALDLGLAFATIDPWASYPYPAETLAAYFAGSEPHAPRFAIEVGGTIAGVVGLRLELLRGPYLQFLGIVPEFQSHGVGGAVLSWMEREAGPSARNLWVCAANFNADALRFYERFGFRRVALLDGLVQDDRDEILLRKRLK